MAGIVKQLSQEEILEIMNQVKMNRISVDEAVAISMGKSIKKKVTAEQEKIKFTNMTSQDPLPSLQYNFSVYKYRYRWQKRILQIDFYSKTVFNIEKGILKKQFPFTQIKSIKDNEGLKFLITFYGHQDYELEAASLEDKENILKVMNDVIKCSVQISPETLYKRPSQSNVLYEGMLELQTQGPDSEKWVKYLVKLKEEELILYCFEQKNLEPVENTVHLSGCSVYATVSEGFPYFSVHTNGNSYLFRIPMNEQTKNHVNSMKMRDDWVSLLQKYATHNQLSSPRGCGPHGDGKFFDEMPHPAKKQDSPTRNKTEDAAEACNGTDPYSFISKRPLPNPRAKEEPSKPVPCPPQPGVALPSRPPPVPPPLRIAVPNVSKTTKAFHWDIVPNEQINKSMWALDISDHKKIDTLRILHQFPSHDMAGVTGSSSDPLKTQNILLDKKIAHNFNIVLKSFHIEPAQLKEKLLILYEHKEGLTDEHLTELRRYVPTVKDKNVYLAFKGNPSELHIVDQFMLELCTIPDLNSRLDALLAVRELPACMKDLHPLISQKIKACYQLLTSQKFTALLTYVLAMGNYLNENAGKERAKGFRLSSLLKVSQLTGKQRKFTLLHALVEQIQLHEPDLATFSQELTEFEAVPSASVKGLNAEVDVLGKELQKIDQYAQAFTSQHKKTTGRENQFVKDLKDIVQHYRAQQAELSKRANEMKKLYSEVLQKFGESKDQDSQELFEWISVFIKGFQRAYSDIRPA